MKGSLISTAIAEPYAQALMSVALNHDLADAFGEECRSLVALLEESPDLEAFIASPVIKEIDKKTVLRQIMGEGANFYLLNFMMLLVDKRRIIFLEKICQQYIALLRKLTNIVLAEVTSVKELSKEQSESIANKIEELTGARGVEIKTKIDPDLIGGVTIKVGSQVFDASLRGQLRRVSLSLSGIA
ncbi:F0F1 ATP synthase subunit delta [cyanobacterium endosymbiont of Rhopalodia gibberula]|uniref:ATP synthase F1 subunit delta n=1 Tax=cyanobacterium endosymbiont of Rhopalodia gibberula TaxID=1763363 RepID=UPI000DC7411A|nr:ATP synthase F1 subunit delta [cyanobacterium endosymbiont of Rhopalodia gibberula]BBA79004.1 F0F1 ATP synthase subunit delta [cyanobacterium endosymbiont of Rhopalodia gibberula]